MNRNVVLYRLKLGWAGYLAGVRERYKLLMTPGHRGFFMPWLAYIVFVAVTLRWQADVLLLGVLVVRHCLTPSIARLEHEALYLPVAVALAIIIMMVSLIPVQQGYLRAVPMWIAEAFVTILPISAVLTLIALGFYWIDLKTACG